MSRALRIWHAVRRAADVLVFVSLVVVFVLVAACEDAVAWVGGT